MKLILATLLFNLFLFFPVQVWAQEANTNCDNRYLTLVNPVRGRALWFDHSLKPLQDQYQAIEKDNFPATWLLQDDVFQDSELMAEIKKFNLQQEKGVFLEISSQLAQQARVVYPYNAAWFSPNAVFLSGYSQSERRKLIDTLFTNFYHEFGFYPKSVGAWWIDSYSLEYLKNKYQIEAVMIVADQKTTDNYGVWGQWWGVPYYPAKANILTPASSVKNKQDLVVTQWAQRDPKKAYGAGPEISDYSLQANDYTRQGFTTDYFSRLTNVYLDCQNPIGQITIGLETGIESIGSYPEYVRQLNFLRQKKSLQAVTMQQFGQKYRQVFPSIPQKISLSLEQSFWELTPQKRENKFLGDEISYNQNLAFDDYFIADKSNFLSRLLPLKHSSSNYFPLWIIMGFISLGLVKWKKMLKFFWPFSIFFILSYILILRSSSLFGWNVYYGPVVSNLMISQVILIVLILALFFILKIFSPQLFKNKPYLWWILSLSFSLDTVVLALRYSMISGSYYFGIFTDNLRFLGLEFKKPLSLSFINSDFPGYQAAAFLHFNPDKIWDHAFVWVICYPLFHLLLGLGLIFIFQKVNKKLQYLLLGSLILLTVTFVVSSLNLDPRKVYN